MAVVASAAEAERGALELVPDVVLIEICSSWRRIARPTATFRVDESLAGKLQLFQFTGEDLRMADQPTMAKTGKLSAVPMAVRRADGSETRLTDAQAHLVELVLNDDETVSPEKAAVLLGVSRPMVVRWINEGLLEDRRTGSHHKIPLTAVWTLKANRAAAGRAAVASVAASQTDDAAGRRTAAARGRARARVARRDRAS